MKTLRKIGLAIMAIVLCVGISACSSDDDDNNTGLAGTTWKIVSISDIDGELEDLQNATITLNANGTITFSPANVGWSYAHWTYNAPTMKFTLGEDEPDDCIVGSFTISGNTAKWDYYWEDTLGHWSGKDGKHGTITLQKQ